MAKTQVSLQTQVGLKNFTLKKLDRVQQFILRVTLGADTIQ